MRTDDQWFEPNDKVQRVAYGMPPNAKEIKSNLPSPKMGEVLCVSECWEGAVCNHVDFIGYPAVFLDGAMRGFPARNFRKVEEIKLCVEAVRHSKKPKLEEVV